VTLNRALSMDNLILATTQNSLEQLNARLIVMIDAVARAKRWIKQDEDWLAESSKPLNEKDTRLPWLQYAMDYAKKGPARYYRTIPSHEGATAALVFYITCFLKDLAENSDVGRRELGEQLIVPMKEFLIGDEKHKGVMNESPSTYEDWIRIQFDAIKHFDRWVGIADRIIKN
jgi:hypothetical protein